MAAVAIQHRDEIIQAIADGKRLSALSAHYSVSPQAISRALHSDPEYQSALEVGHTVRLDQAEERIEDARDNIDVARAGALWRAVSWRASVEMPHRWGAKQQVSVDHRVSVDERLTASLDRLIGRVVDGQHSVVPDPDHDGTGVMSNTLTDQSVAPAQQIETLQALVDE